MVFIKHNSLKLDIFFNPIFISCFSGSMFLRIHVFPVEFGSHRNGGSGDIMIRVQVFQGPDPGF